MNDRHSMKREGSPLHTKSIQNLSSAIYKKLIGSHDPDITALKESFENLTIEIGLQAEKTPKEEERRHWIVLLFIYLITLLISPFTNLYKNANCDNNTDDIETTTDEQIDIFEKGISSAYNNSSDEANEILAMIESLLEMVRLSISESNGSTPSHQTISEIESDSFDDNIDISYVNFSSASLLSILSNSESFITDDDGLSNASFSNEEANLEKYALVHVYKDEVLHSLNLETFFKTIGELTKANINRLKSDEINIPDDLENKLLAMIAKLENILHQYKPEESWAKQYRKQKRIIAKLIHPDKHPNNQENKDAAALIAPIIIHSLFEAIDKLIERLDAGESVDTCDDDVESYFKDIWQSMKESAEKIKEIKKRLKEMTAFHQEASERIQKMGEEIKQIGADYRRMFEETKKANKEMGEILKRQDIRIEKMDELSKKTEAILKASKQSRLLSDLMMHHSKKQFELNNKSIQASKDNIYKKISIMNAILDQHETGAIESISDEPTSNPHQLFTEKSSFADQHTKEYHDIALDFGKC